MPKEGIKNATNRESTVLDEANRRRRVSRRHRMRKFSVSSTNEKDRPKTLRISLAGPSTVYLKKKLIVLDVNGLLVDIVSPPPKGRKADATVGKKALFKRPFYRDFLNFCFEKFEVAIWSSRIRKNVDYVIDYLMGNMKQRLLFVGIFLIVTKTSFKTLENPYKPLVFKDLRKIWEKYDSKLPWEKGYYNESNTLLLDDSPYKALLNPPCNSVFPHSFNFQNQNDNSLGRRGDLRVYLKGLANAENIQKYVERLPFGQAAIDERSQSWSFYQEVLDSLSTH